MRYFLFAICFFLLGQSLIYGQTAKPDSTRIVDEFELAEPLDSVAENLSEDIMINPADTLYNHIWDHINISYNSGKFPARKDTLAIALVGKNESKYVHPTKGKVISAYRTKRRPGHTGTDIKLNLGDTVRCAFDGKVRLAKRYSGYGNLVLVRHHNGLETVYGHLSKMCVKQNQMVKAGDVLGLGGRTGRATTTHLHFETRIFGKSFDSAKYIDFESGTTQKTVTEYFEYDRKIPSFIIAHLQLLNVLIQTHQLQPLLNPFNNQLFLRQLKRL